MPRIRDGRRLAEIIGLMVLAAFTVAVLAYAVHDQGQSDEADADSASVIRPLSSDEQAAKEDDSETVVYVIGDSFTGGSLMNTGPVWLDQLATTNGWIVSNDSVGGSGYVNGGPADQPFASRLSNLKLYKSDLVILAGGINDEFLPPADVKAAAKKELQSVQQLDPTADIVMFSPFANGHSRPTLDAQAKVLKQVAADGGVPYIDVRGFLNDGDIGEDGTHPTDAGHEKLAAKINMALSNLGLPRADAYQQADETS